MRQVSTRRDPWHDPGFRQTVYRIRQKGSRLTYYRTDGYNVVYDPNPQGAKGGPKMQAFQQVRAAAREWFEAHPMEGKPLFPYVGKNDNLLNQFPRYMGGYYVDVSCAYWRTAFNMGVINRELFERWRKDKYIRNAAIGALASKSVYYSYDPETDTREFEGIERESTANVYYHIVNDVGQKMQDLQQEGFFYWVDCIYSPFGDIGKEIRSRFPRNFEFHENEFVSLTYIKPEETIYTKFRGKRPKPYHFQRRAAFFEE